MAYDQGGGRRHTRPIAWLTFVHQLLNGLTTKWSRRA